MKSIRTSPMGKEACSKNSQIHLKINYIITSLSQMFKDIIMRNTTFMIISAIFRACKPLPEVSMCTNKHLYS